ncbi:glycosyltransferase [Clostridium estertheticum]|uniref:glycosyltransferase n=1 Tax=Clostridium estertheticum TaxID=238834 RepID=UPI001C0ABC4F|nr:glycosyltransferase [Clostridium estertheticum]MBU3073198.1 glycosyltransferase [Clostridium estertheticum]MBU3163561.1 glycosyltransferase [Clostridium estertheticum]
MVNYSVLMSVYYKEQPQFLQASIQSMLDQTVLTNNFIIVCDGKLTYELDKVITHYQESYPNILNVIRLSENKGLGNALNIGLTYCKNSLVARMDSDDISYPNRCELQLKCFEKNVDIVSAAVEEFSNDIRKVTAIRNLKEKHVEILKISKSRNPFNHPCVMYRKETVFKAGNYQEFYLYEDYYLWIRMLQGGAVGYNIQIPLLHMRAGEEMYRRRGGYKYFLSSKKFQRYLLDNQIIGFWKYIYNTVIRFLVQVIIPDCVRRYVFRVLMRSSSR